MSYMLKRDIQIKYIKTYEEFPYLNSLNDKSFEGTIQKRYNYMLVMYVTFEFIKSFKTLCLQT